VKAHFRYAFISLIVLLSSLLLLNLPISKQLLKIADLRIYDTLVDFANALSNKDKEAVYDDICIVDIDEKSIATLGQASTMQRFLYADLIDALAADEPLAIGFDVFFTESDSIFGYARTRMKEQIEYPNADKIINMLSSDAVLAAAIERAGNVYLAMFNSNDSSPPKELPSTLSTWNLKPRSYLPLSNPHPPIHEFSEVAAGVGFAHIEPDESGIIHDFPLFLGYQGKFMLNFSFQMCLDLLGVDRIESNDNCKLYSGNSKVREIPLSRDGSCYIKYYGKKGAFRYISFSDVLRQRIQPGYFKDRIVLVGSSASGLRDIKSTPLDSNYPGVELHATFIRNVLESDHIHWLDIWWVFALDFVLLLLLVIVIRNTKPLLSISLFVIVTVLFFPLFYILYVSASLSLSYSAILLPWIIGFTSIFSAQSHDQTLEKKKVRNAFEHYVSGDVINQIMKGSQSLSPGGEKKTVSILLADVRNFTSYCEKLSPAEITGFMNRYFNEATKLIVANRGLLDKYIGDAVLALYGAPLPYQEFAYNAVKTALEIRDLSFRFKAEYAQHPVLSCFRIGLGIATGEVIVGNIGSDSIFNYTGIGDRMNFCSRLESLNKYYGTSIIIDENTYRLVQDRFFCRRLDRVTVKGKEIVSDIYEVIDLLDAQNTDQNSIACYRTYETALALMHSGHQAEAKAQLLEALNFKADDKPSSIMLERLDVIDWNRWDGVWQHECK
jgi:adenylate cyclase